MVRAHRVILFSGLLLLAAYLLGLFGPPPAGKREVKPATDAESMAFVEKLVESLVKLQNQQKICQDCKVKYLAHPDPPAIDKGQKETEKLFKMLDKERLWLTQEEEDADKRWTETTRLTLKRFRELAAEWRGEATKIEAQATALRKFWEAEKAKNR